MLMSNFVPANDKKVYHVCKLMGYICGDEFPFELFDTDVSVRAVRRMLRKYSVATAEDYIWRLVRYLKQVPNFARVEDYCDILEVCRAYTKTHICD